MQTYTDGRLEGHLRSREARLLQPDKFAAISAFDRRAGFKNVKNNPMRSSRQGTRRWLRAEPETVWSEGAVAGIPAKLLI
jgi:hypothetical protein